MKMAISFEWVIWVGLGIFMARTNNWAQMIFWAFLCKSQTSILSNFIQHSTFKPKGSYHHKHIWLTSLQHRSSVWFMAHSCSTDHEVAGSNPALRGVFFFQYSFNQQLSFLNQVPQGGACEMEKKLCCLRRNQLNKHLFKSNVEKDKVQ